MRKAVWINITATLLSTIASADLVQNSRGESFLIRTLPDGSALLTNQSGREIQLPAAFVESLRKLSFEAPSDPSEEPRPCAGFVK